MLRLPESVRTVDLISDLHLGPDLPRTVQAFERYLAGTRADALFILGDLFEAWVGDDALQQAFEAGCAAALVSASRRLRIHVMRGNRDFLLGERFFAETGCQALPDPLAVRALGHTWLMSHGDALCLADTDYQRFRAQVRSVEWQSAFLARPLSERLSVAAAMRAASRAHQGVRDSVTYADADPALADAWLDQAGAEGLIHGHTHRPGNDTIGNGHPRWVLSDWDLDHAQPPRAEVLRWTADGLRRVALADL